MSARVDSVPTAKIDARALRNQTTPVHAVVDRRDVATLKKLRPRNIRARSQPTTHLSLRPSINKTLSARGKPAARLSVSPASCPSNPSIRAPFAKNFQRGRENERRLRDNSAWRNSTIDRLFSSVSNLGKFFLLFLFLFFFSLEKC